MLMHAFRINFDINLESIYVNGQTLPINQSTFKQGRTRINSETNLAYMARGAYLYLLDAVSTIDQFFLLVYVL